MIVYFLRHANAGQHKLDAEKDEKRPIDREGERQSHDVGRALRALKVEVELVISSPLTRALQTAVIAAEEIGHKDAIVTDDALRPEANYAEFEELLSRYKKHESILVGHNPSMTEFLKQLLSGSRKAQILDFKKGAVAKVEIERGKALLKWLITPRVARAFSGTRKA